MCFLPHTHVPALKTYTLINFSDNNSEIRGADRRKQDCTPDPTQDQERGRLPFQIPGPSVRDGALARPLLRSKLIHDLYETTR